MTQLFAVFSNTQGPDGNGLITPFDPLAGGIGGGTVTSDNALHLCSGGFVPPDKMTTDIDVIVLASQGTAGLAPTGGWRARVGATVIRNGNTVTIQGNGTSSDVRSTSGLGALKAEVVIDASVSPNQVSVQVKGVNAAPAITWQWRGTSPFSIGT